METRRTFWNWSRVLSLLVVMWYIIFALMWGTGETIFNILFVSSPLPMLCIWYPREMGDYKGVSLAFPKTVNQTSPEGIIHLLGWIVLLLPVLSWLVVQLLISPEI